MQTTTQNSPSNSNNFDSTNRRRADRAPLNLLVQFRSENENAFARDFSKNLSSSGMFIETISPREEGSFLYFQFQVGEQSHYIEGLGKVVRVCRKTKDGVCGMGIQFINVDDKSQAHIDSLVEARLSAARAH